MAKRETFETAVTCHRCAKNGTATWEENENPVHAGGLERELIEVPPGFRRGQNRDDDGDPDIVCNDCKPNL
jgi:hypothetical protein